MLIIKKMSIGIIIFVLFTQLTFGQDEMFSLIRKINVDHLGTVGQIDGCEFSKDNYYIIASDNHGTAKIYIRSSGKYVNEVKHIVSNNLEFERAGKVNAVGYSYNRKYLYTGINDRGLKVWDANTYKLLHHFGDGFNTDSADFSSDDKWLAMGAGSEVWLYSVPGFTRFHKFFHERGEVNNLDFNHDNSLLASCASKGEVFITRTSDWKRIRRHKIKSSAKRIYFSPDGQFYALGGRDQLCRVYRTSDGVIVADLKHRGNLKMLPGDDYGDDNPAVETLNWSAEGKYLFTGGVIDGIMRVWRRDDWSLVGYVQAQATNRQIEYIDVSSDNEVIVGGDEGVLYHYTFAPPKLLTPFVQESDGAVCLEVENYDTSLPQGGHRWTVISEIGAAGGECLQALPNDGVKKDAKFAEYDPIKDAPKLDYRINFTRTGNYHVWIRAKGNKSDNSVHVGINGKGIPSSDMIEFPPSTSNYVWSKATKDKQDAFISISSIGFHTINVWMDEDGTKLDRILLTSDAGYDPSNVNGGKGPKGSIRKTPDATVE
ncbi:MAG: WD40 domain-containing protein [Planctomycetota bacterium]|jgi:WD40 repeat protein